MRGTSCKLSIPRRLIVDLMRASQGVPLITFQRTLSVAPLARARQAAELCPGWAAIFAKAFSLVGRDQPVLRTLYVTWPWPHLFELPHSIAMVAIARQCDGEDCVMTQKLIGADAMALAEIDAAIRHAKTAPIGEVRAFRKMLQVTRLPLPLRRLAWLFALNVGRQRANHFGTFGLSSVAAFGPGALYPIGPGPFILSYGAVSAEGTIDVVIRFDHRVTDAALIATAMTRLEQALNGPIAEELQALPRIVDKPARAVRG
ncbi:MULTISPECIES: acyltransferase [Rhodopseudomonas]|uniref:Acyltransferase n=1 Tax=Rhodopseudomonas palustris TaxID=1076 RepID=A0A0D7EV48_RHOPL|nr:MULTISPECIES: acyltransferase [Rhodopseudomonas]KIZ43302.1 acyltransferase [Rhodopseudomonas palustris]MDF3810183.1 acyltransferase [Rhodopseudomonas sp. BAL398]WOK20168.1 acyltransferase [Rhodopseudomonas sp. BAL398]